MSERTEKFDIDWDRQGLKIAGCTVRIVPLNNRKTKVIVTHDDVYSVKVVNLKLAKSRGNAIE